MEGSIALSRKRQEMERAQKVMEVRHQFPKAWSKGRSQSGQTGLCPMTAQQSHWESVTWVTKQSLNHVLQGI